MQNPRREFRLSDFDFDLPAALIAQQPAQKRSASRLLVVGQSEGSRTTLDDRMFAELPTLLAPGDLVVFNNTRVIRARLIGVKDSGGRVEVMIERIVNAREALEIGRAHV